MPSSLAFLKKGCFFPIAFADIGRSSPEGIRPALLLPQLMGTVGVESEGELLIIDSLCIGTLEHVVTTAAKRFLI